MAPKVITNITSEDDNDGEERLANVKANASINQLSRINNSKTKDDEMDYNDNDAEAMDFVSTATPFQKSL